MSDNDSAEQASRDNAGKPEMSYLLDLHKSLTEVVRVMEYGAGKYAPRNWLKGGKPDAEYLSAALRHIFRHSAESDTDPESGCLHLAHAAWNLLALLELNVLDCD